MQQTIQTRLAFIATIAASFGYIIYKLVDVKNSSFAVTGVALLLSLIASLTISIYLTGRLTKKKRQLFALIATAMLFLSIASFYTFQDNFNKSTFTISEFHNDSVTISKYFKGLKYTKGANDLIKLEPAKYENNDNALLEAYENDYTKVWIQDTVRDCELTLAMWYIFFVIIVVSSISLTTEVLTIHEKTKKKRASNQDQ